MDPLLAARMARARFKLAFDPNYKPVTRFDPAYHAQRAAAPPAPAAPATPAAAPAATWQPPTTPPVTQFNPTYHAERFGLEQGLKPPPGLPAAHTRMSPPPAPAPAAPPPADDLGADPRTRTARDLSRRALPAVANWWQKVTARYRSPVQ